ncbi:MAG: DUF1574 domain-containing protein [Leptospira sp.]|nr:DUF1574 domain-containing protein [Leptospira sp.]NCS92588.1 DUF1574 domain-containing protein [Leptospira sp.]
MNLFISYFKKSPAFFISVAIIVLLEGIMYFAPILEYMDPTGVYYTSLKRDIAESENNFDYIMLGDSRSLSIKGRKSNLNSQENANSIAQDQYSLYNFSLPAAGTRYIQHFIDKYLAHNKKPRGIIYALDIEQFRPGQSAAFNVDPKIWSIFKHRLLNLFTFTENVSQYKGKEQYFILKEALPYTIPSVRHREGLDKLITGMRPKDIQNGDLPYLRSNQRLEKLTKETYGQVNLGTYLEIPSGITLDMIQEIVDGSIEAQNSETPNMENLVSFLEYASQKKIPVIILEVPHADGLPQSAFYTKVRLEYKKIAEQYSNVYFQAFPSNSYSLDYFAEGIHFNGKGEIRVNEEFEKFIWPNISKVIWKD